MTIIKDMIQKLFCRFELCGGYVVSGTHDGVVWVGWRCGTCGRVKSYAPAHRQEIGQ